MTSTTPTTPTTATTTPTTPARSARRRTGRALTVLAAALAAGLVFGVLSVFGTDFVITDPGSTDSHAFGFLEICVLSLVISAVGWGTLALLERLTGRGTAIWTALGVLVFALSLVPIFIETATTATQIGLIAVHLTLAAVLITGLRRFAA